MIIEHVRNGDPTPVYERFRERGRLAPGWLAHIQPYILHPTWPLAGEAFLVQLSTMGEPAFDYLSLSIDERLKLVGDIWDSIADAANAAPELLPLTDAQKAELNRRVAEHDADPSTSIPMDEALESVRARLRRP